MRGISRFVALCACSWTVVVSAATITVDSLADDVFVNNAGTTFSDVGLTTPVAPPPRCTLRMAIAAANLNIPVGGCAAGAAGADTVVFSGALTYPAVITLANHASRAVPPSYPDPTPLGVASALIASESLTLIGPGASQLTIDATAPGTSGYRALLLSDGVSSTLSSFTFDDLRVVGGRAVNGGGGCLFSSDHVSMTRVVLQNCASVGQGSQPGIGGAAGFGNTDSSQRPNLTLNEVTIMGSRAERGTSTFFPVAGGFFAGSTTRSMGAVSLDGVLIYGNSAEQAGGVWISNANSVTVTNSGIISNIASGEHSASAATNGRYGGMRIENVSGNVSLSVAVVGNTANVERAGLSIATVGGTTTINNESIFAGNLALNGRIGGFEVLTGTFNPDGSCNTVGGPVNISQVLIESNRAPIAIGGFRIFCSGATTITDVTVRANESTGGPAYSTLFAAGSAAAAFQLIGPITSVNMTNVTIESNVTTSFAGTGGFRNAVVDNVGAFTAVGLKVRNNRVSRGESGLSLLARNASRTYAIVDSEFTGNVNLNGNGMLAMSSDGIYNIANTTFAHNIMSGGGGTINLNGHTTTPGGITLNLVNVTSARNRADFAEAFYANAFVSPGTPIGSNASVNVVNSLFGGRAYPASTSVVTVEPVIGTFNRSYSLVEFFSGHGQDVCVGTGMKCNMDARIDNALSLDPAISRTMALRSGSPALDAGSNAAASSAGLINDQRGTGFPRIVGTVVDIGAHESPPLPPVTACNLDMDGDAQVHATKEGLVLLRSMLGLNAAAAVAGTGITEAQWNATRANLNANCGTSLGG